jgi:hypothetical protein
MTVGPAWAEKEASSESDETRRAAPLHPERARLPFAHPSRAGQSRSTFENLRTAPGLNRRESRAAT